jgi:GAF domain-containing protein
MKCPRCQQDNPSHTLFCLKCGAPVTGADPIARSYADLKSEVESLRRSQSEALEQQTATAEVLKVISRSTFDLQPVLETLVENAAKLCDANQAVILRFDGEVLRAGATYGTSPEVREYARGLELRPERGSIVGRVALEQRAVHVLDVLADPEYQFADAQKLAGYRTILGVPMLREDTLIGAFFISRTEVRGFTDKQIELVTTFADQAVIAIENVRLFKELQEKNQALTQAHAQVSESIEQQTATSEILSVISSSPTDIQPVLDAVTARAARVCGATDAVVVRVEGRDMRRVSHFGPIPLVVPAVRRITSGSITGRAILECRPIHIHDILDADVARDYPESPTRGGGVANDLHRAARARGHSDWRHRDSPHRGPTVL